MKHTQNISLEGDLALARMELGAFLPGAIDEVSDVTTVMHRLPQLAELRGFGALGSYVRQNGIQAYTASGPLVLLPDLACRLSFVQRIYCVAQDTEDVRK